MFAALIQCSSAFLALFLRFNCCLPWRSKRRGRKEQFSSGQMMLRGSAQLLGLLFEKAQRREEALQEKKRMAEVELMELKHIRAEDAKANEKVVSIFAAREQAWQAERRRLLQQIHSLARELRSSKEETVVRDDLFEEEARKRRELEEKLRVAQRAAEEWKERAGKEAQDHSSELRRHKTAFTELVSNQRQLEAELARVLRQAEDAKLELADVYEQKGEAAAMVEKLSEEFVRLQKDAEQKGKVVSAMLRKAKHDTAEKHAVLKELRITRAKKQQAELEAARWRSMDLRPDAGSSRERLAELQTSSRLDLRTRLFDYLTAEKSDSTIKPMELPDQYVSEEDDRLDDVHGLQDWVRLETKKYTVVLEQRHLSEIEAFAEQLRRLQSHIDGLDGSLTQLRDENLKLEALLEDREKQLKSLKERFELQGKLFQEESLLAVETDLQKNDGFKNSHAMQQLNDKDPIFRHDSMPSTSNSPNEEIQEEKEISLDTIHLHTRHSSVEDAFALLSTKLASDGQPFLKMDIQALGISFKIKRLRQQLTALENLIGAQSLEANFDTGDVICEERFQLKGLTQVLSLLNKQLKRYQSLEEKTDALCRRILENSRTGTSRLAQDGATKERTEKLEQLLEETFQLQRFMVATGQKLMELHGKINCSCSGFDGLEESAGFNMGQFLDVVITLFKDVQRGLEVRLARIIGDIEGTLACEGILRS
ncbi:hypothetical protein HPP92_027927 [Vanilla planifolia]|uniref:Uncharacterized protein n=1 Tax=Vanilla planifolia TaxID=51239 RepID=A0A835PAM9_VANPL|nr:hypothetical protein HPP92_027927 [Vanilla planifolia]